MRKGMANSMPKFTFKISIVMDGGSTWSQASIKESGTACGQVACMYTG